MDIVTFTQKVQQEFGLEPEFIQEEFEYICKVRLDIGDLNWSGIGINIADGNQVCIDKACKFFSWS